MFSRHQHIPAVSWSFNEGRYWDLWMIVHILSGAIASCILVLLQLPAIYSYPVAIVALAGWELGEMTYGIEEEPENWVLDIVFGMLGFWFVYEKVLPGMERLGIVGVGGFLLLFNVLFALLGWGAYRKRSK